MTQYTLEMTDDRQRKMDKAAGILAKDEFDDPPKSKVIDAALTHLLASHDNISQYRDDLQTGETSVTPREAARLLNTSVMSLSYRTHVDVSR